MSRVKHSALDLAAILSIAAYVLFTGYAYGEDGSTSLGPQVCQYEAPWNNPIQGDNRSWTHSEPEMPDRVFHSGHSASGLSGLWDVQFRNIPKIPFFPTNARLAFHQEGEGYSCEGEHCGYKPGKKDAKWMYQGERWGYVNYGPVTSEKPEDVPPGYATVSESGSVTLPAARYFVFPTITVKVPDAGSDVTNGTWVFGSGEQQVSGTVDLKRIEPNITAVKFRSNIEHVISANETGCVVLDYSPWWGPGNDMRGNRPGFRIDVIGEGFHRFAPWATRAWIDWDSRLEIDSSSPAPLFDDNGKVIGLTMRINIWPGSKWGRKVLFVGGAPVHFDYYVNPVYPFVLDETRMTLIAAHYPEKQHPRMTTQLGFRLVNLPDHAAKDTVVNLEFVDAKTGEPATGLKSLDKRCQVASENALRCQFKRIAIAGMEEFEAEVTMSNGGLRWYANWKSDGDIEPEGRSGTVDVDERPVIIHSYTSTDQEGGFRPQSRLFLAPYPDGGKVSQAREIVLVGNKLLPESPGEVPRIESASSAITYVPRLGNVYSDRYAAAWADLSRRFAIPEETLKKSYEVLILDAQIRGTVVPGPQVLTINGSKAKWDLRFGGLSAKIEFVRENDPYGDDEDDEDDDVLTTAYVPEAIYVRVKTTSDVPVDTLPLNLHLKQTIRDPAYIASGITTSKIETRAIRATKTSQGYYYSPPIRLIDRNNSRMAPLPQAGDIAVNVFPNGAGTDLLSVEIDPDFVAREFAMPVTPADASLPISRSPEYHRSQYDLLQDSSWLFKTALTEAAACHDAVEFDDWDDLTDLEAERLRRYVVFTFDEHVRQTTVTLGDHAAMLLLRRLFIESLNDVVARNDAAMQSEMSLLGFLKAMRYEVNNGDLAINRIRVTGPDGQPVEYGSYALLEDSAWLAKTFNTTPERIARWRLQATAEALYTISVGASKAAAEARQVGNCDVEDLLKLTSSGFAGVAARLKPRLMHLVEADADTGTTHLFWEPDQVARDWVDSVAEVGKRYRADAAAAETDNTLLMASFGVLSMPVMMVGSTASVLAVTAADLTMIGATSVMDWQKAYYSYAEIDFSRNAAVVIGIDRNEAARKSAHTWLGAYAKTVANLGGAVMAVAGTTPQLSSALMRQDNLVINGRAAVRSIPEQGGLRALPEVDQRDVQLYAMRAKTREAALGAEALDAVDRRAITAVDEDFRAARTELQSRLDAHDTSAYNEVHTLPPPFGQPTRKIEFDAATETLGPESFPTVIDHDQTLLMARVAEDDIATRIIRSGSYEDDIATYIESGRRAWSTEIDIPAGTSADAADETGTLIIAGPRPSQDDLATHLSGPASSTAAPPGPDSQVIARIAGIQRARAQTLAEKLLYLPPEVTRGSSFHVQLGIYRGGGSYSAAVESLTPFQDYATLIKLQYGIDDIAEVTGRRLLESVNGRYFVLPRESLTLSIPNSTGGQLHNFRSIKYVEDFGDNAEQVIRAGNWTNDHTTALRNALNELNDRGIVMLDFKLNNFSFVERDGVLKVGFFDFGGFVRTKGGNAAVAREMQSYLAGPWDGVVAGISKYKMGFGERAVDPTARARSRANLIRHAFNDHVENMEGLGVTHLDFFSFNPSARESLNEANIVLTPAGQ